jgi:Asp-tRNA(Asn)/Glu-tRNA(Gln) amidotransferase C subunit
MVQPDWNIGDGSSVLINRLREDTVTNEDKSAELVAGAPDSKGSYFRVPRTVEE